MKIGKLINFVNWCSKEKKEKITRRIETVPGIEKEDETGERKENKNEI